MPANFKQLVNEREQAKRESQSQQLRAWLGGDLALQGKPSKALRDKLKEAMRKHSDSDVLRCPLCNVECKANRLVAHFDKQHYGKQ